MAKAAKKAARPAKAPEKEKEKKVPKLERTPAVRYLEDLLFDYLLHTGQAVKSAELAEAIEPTIKVDPKFVRRVLHESDRFVSEERRWNLTLRAMINRPFEGLVEFALRSYGKPMPYSALHNEMALVLRRPVDFFEGLLEDTLRGRNNKYFETDGHWGLTEWLLNTEGKDREEVFLRNFFLTQPEVRPIVDDLLASRISPDQPAEALAEKLIRRRGEPIPSRVLAYVVWSMLGRKFDPKRFFEGLRADDKLLLLSGPAWTLSAFVEDYHQELKRLSKKWEKEEDLAWMEEEAAEAEPMAAITPADIKDVVAYMKGRKQPVRASQIAASVFEIPPSSRGFEPACELINTALAADPQFRRVGVQTWTFPDGVPGYVGKVPAELRVKVIEPGEGEEAEVDAELEDGGLELGLAAWVHDPRYEDFGEEPEIDITAEQQATDQLRYILLADHWKLGTLKLRTCDRRFFPTEHDPVCVTLATTAGKSFPVWVSHSAALLYDLAPWYKEDELVPGSVFIVRVTPEPDCYSLIHEGEVDPLIAISPERLKELEKLSKEAAKENWSVFQILSRLMSDYRKGLHFLNLWSEVSVVRRTTRRVVASDLTSYHCFFQRPAGSDTWLYDERKVGQGRKKTKKKYIIKR